MIMTQRANQELCPNRLRERVPKNVGQDIFLIQKSIEPSGLSPNRIIQWVVPYQISKIFWLDIDDGRVVLCWCRVMLHDEHTPF